MSTSAPYRASDDAAQTGQQRTSCDRESSSSAPTSTCRSERLLAHVDGQAKSSLIGGGVQVGPLGSGDPEADGLARVIAGGSAGTALLDVGHGARIRYTSTLDQPEYPCNSNPMTTPRRERALTNLQAQVLGSVSQHRHAASPSSVASDLLISAGTARSALVALERRGLVTAIYTGIGVRGRCFEVTGRAEAALAAAFSEEADEYRVCERCGDDVRYLSSADLCDGCEAYNDGRVQL